MAKVVKVQNHLFELIRQKELAEGRRITNKEVAGALGITVNTLKNWLDGDIEQFSGKILVAARHYFGVESISQIVEFEEVDVAE